MKVMADSSNVQGKLRWAEMIPLSFVQASNSGLTQNVIVIAMPGDADHACDFGKEVV
jgi:hypothetical protein